MNRTLDPRNLEQTYDKNPSQVVFEHVQNFDAVIRDRRRSASNHTSAYNGLIQVLGLLYDRLGIVEIGKDNLEVYIYTDVNKKRFIENVA